MRFTKHLPGINCNLDPVINFKLKQKISHFGACITLGEGEPSQTIPQRTGNALKMLSALCVLFVYINSDGKIEMNGI